MLQEFHDLPHAAYINNVLDIIFLWFSLTFQYFDHSLVNKIILGLGHLAVVDLAFQKSSNNRRKYVKSYCTVRDLCDRFKSFGVDELDFVRSGSVAMGGGFDRGVFEDRCVVDNVPVNICGDVIITGRLAL